METTDNKPLDRLKFLDGILDEYEVTCGLPKYNDAGYSSEAEQYLNMSRAQLEKLTPEQCAETACLLGSLSFHIQRAYNREIARVNWADGVVKSMLAGREANYRGSWESQLNQAINENTYAKKVYEIKQYAKQRADRLTFLATSMKNMCDLLGNLQRAKSMK